MKPYQRQFIEFALNKQVLKFGEFTLKSGRQSPYFLTLVYLIPGAIWRCWAVFMLRRWSIPALISICCLVRLIKAFLSPPRPPSRYLSITNATYRTASTAKKPKTMVKAATWSAARFRAALCWWTM